PLFPRPSNLTPSQKRPTRDLNTCSRRLSKLAAGGHTRSLVASCKVVIGQMIFHRFSTKSNRPKILLPAFVALFFCLFLAAPSISAQQDQTPDETISVNTSLVQLNVGVVDRQGHAITNLTASDFAVYEDGVRQNIAS